MSKEELEFKLFEYVEGVLSPEEKAQVEQMILENEDLQAELELLKLTMLTPEPVVFENKEALKKKSSIIPLWMGTSLAYKSAAAAAVLIASVGVYQWINTLPSEYNTPSIATEITIPLETGKTEKDIAANKNFEKIEHQGAEKRLVIEHPDKSLKDKSKMESAPVRIDDQESQIPQSNELLNDDAFAMVEVPKFKDQLGFNLSEPSKSAPEKISHTFTDVTLPVDYSTHWSKGLRNGVAGVFINGVRNIKKTKIRFKKSENDGPVLVLTTKNYEVLAQLNNRNNNVQQN